jgi:hypothetical protein
MVEGVNQFAHALNFRQEETMLRRQLISTLLKLFGLSVLGLGTADAQTTEAHKSFNIMIKSAWEALSGSSAVQTTDYTRQERGSQFAASA